MDAVDPSTSRQNGFGEKSLLESGLETPTTRGVTPSSKKNRLGRCVSCGSELRRSRFQKGDFLRLFLFQVPARCRRCGDRQHTFSPMAVLAGEPWRPMKRATSGSGPERKNWSPPLASGRINMRERNAPMVPPELLLDQKKKPPVRGRVDGYIW
ncbi:hypothetical protein [Terriglobus saanensis]|uniref:Uncharacterized protein n=1 Tax=Terriglobus saanensis (strain ATCC BAA-1853 / DSM 23119 / SP1PR4) TaxID=401053 RepID=E8V0Q8_TERSS|nr:hypothetical protein [Terriglobus saanensis]ADV81121.1 hypothetical protein AciPR4_0283 [Terriglobus saanensis SP1PR4]